MNKIHLVLLLFLLPFFFTVCTTDSSDKDLGDPFIIGFITEIEPESRRVLVEENIDVDEPLSSGGNKIWFSINEKTELFLEQVDGTDQKCDLDQLSVGSKAKGWVTGAVAESYPLQGTARKIVQLSQ